MQSLPDIRDHERLVAVGGAIEGGWERDRRDDAGKRFDERVEGKTGVGSGALPVGPADIGEPWRSVTVYDCVDKVRRSCGGARLVVRIVPSQRLGEECRVGNISGHDSGLVEKRRLPEDP